VPEVVDGECPKGALGPLEVEAVSPQSGEDEDDVLEVLGPQ